MILILLTNLLLLLIFSFTDSSQLEKLIEYFYSVEILNVNNALIINVAKLDALSAETKKLEAIYKQSLADFEELKKSVLKKAFSGEL
jgi:hypothetical protein